MGTWVLPMLPTSLTLVHSPTRCFKAHATFRRPEGA